MNLRDFGGWNPNQNKINVYWTRWLYMSGCNSGMYLEVSMFISNLVNVSCIGFA